MITIIIIIVTKIMIMIMIMINYHYKLSLVINTAMVLITLCVLGSFLTFSNQLRTLP